MPVVAGKVFTTTLAGKRVKSVICERCGQAFFYELSRHASGKGSALYFIGQHEASERSAVAANRQLEEILEREVELVPCPRCKWINDAVVKQYRRQRYRGILKWILIAFFGGLIGTVLLSTALVNALGYDSKVPGLLTVTITPLALLSPIWIPSIRALLRRRINPNRYHPQPPLLPPLTPPVMIESKDPKTGELVLVQPG